MKRKYIDIIFMGILLCVLFSLPALAKSLDTITKSSIKKSAESPTFLTGDYHVSKKSVFDELPAMNQSEKNTIAREYHSNYDELVEAMLTLSGQGHFTRDVILDIHKHISDFEVNSTTEIPYTDKDLLEYLYDNNIITHAQYEQILDILDDND